MIKYLLLFSVSMFLIGFSIGFLFVLYEISITITFGMIKYEAPLIEAIDASPYVGIIIILLITGIVFSILSFMAILSSQAENPEEIAKQSYVS